MAKFEYILGDSSSEVKRLAFQAGVWRKMTEALLDRHRVGPGWRCLELGPGTGTVFFPLAKRVQAGGGTVDGIERSPRYVEYLRRQARRRRVGNVRVIEGEILETPLPPNHYDFIFARWVFIFLPRVEEHLRHLARALKPGGLIAIEDYHRPGVGMYPRPSTWPLMMAADSNWFATQGGDISVAGRLPQLFRKIGLETVEVKPNVQIGGPSSDVWKWAELYFIGFLDTIAKHRPFTKATAAKFRREWLANKKDPSSIFISPMILDVVGRKKGRR